MKTTQECFDIVKSFEGLHDGNLKVIGLQPKLCPALIYTEGYGRAMKFKDGTFMTKANTTEKQANERMTIHTKEEAEKALVEDINEFSERIKPFIKVEINDLQFGSLVSFSYNLGTNALKNSTLLKKLNLKDFVGASNEFLRWNKCDGKVMEGLSRRRRSERDLFLKK